MYRRALELRMPEVHHAVKALRDELEKSGERSFPSWVPFIRVGM